MTYDLDRLTAPLTVSSKIQETGDAVSLVFSVPKERQKEFRFGPGQYVTLFLPIKGETLARSYSICASPLTDPDLKITVKRVKGGSGSNFIVDQIKIGDTIRVSPPAGHFFRPPASPGPHHWLLIAAGSGITPIFSILKTVLMSEPRSKVSLVYANRAPDQIIYSRELEEWAKKFPDRFDVLHVLSKPPEKWEGLRGRCEGELLQQILKRTMGQDTGTLEVYLCGPDGFMRNFQDCLSSQFKVPDQQIHYESFTPGVTPAHPHPAPLVDAGPQTRVYIGDASSISPSGPVQLRATINGEEIAVTMTAKQTVLEALLEAGANAPYSCLEGQCMACMAKVRKGRVYQDDPGILLDDNISASEALTCQARPAASEVEVNYDL